MLMLVVTIASAVAALIMIIIVVIIIITVMGFLDGSEGKESAHSAGDPGSIAGSGRSPGDENVSNILAWRILWTEDPSGLQSMGLQRVRHFGCKSQT